ncbi:MAG: trypsin-like peptidase domain-containing protein [Planctomycetales bacterium]|nr:trypsin-like peptidase domain-containing protein [Planctomycetales bacterium]
MVHLPPRYSRAFIWSAGLTACVLWLIVPTVATAQRADLPEDAAAALAQRSPESIEDLRLIQDQLGRVVKRAVPATVGLRVGNGMGSGVVVNPEGLILTAGHVVGRAGRRVTVIFSDGRRLMGRSLGADHDADAGMVQLDDPPADLAYSPIAEDETLPPGTWVVTTGQPGGIVADRAPPVRLGRVLFTGHDVVCTDCEIVGGDSGGPLLNMRGEVVGIHSSIGPMINQNFHVAISAYRREWDRLAASEVWGGDEDRDEARGRPLLGVAGRTEGGCLITQVFADMPAERAGLKAGDVITAVDDNEIATFEDLITAVNAKSPGRRLRLEIRRGEEILEFRVRLAGIDRPLPGSPDERRERPARPESELAPAPNPEDGNE